MKLIDLIRLIRKHLILLIAVPLLMAVLAIALTKNPKLIYSSQTVLFTGLATGSSIEMDKTFNYFVTNTAFDNLLNIISSRATQEEIAIRLLSQHLLLGKPDPKYISEKSFKELKALTPKYIYRYIVRKRSSPAAYDSISTSFNSGNPFRDTDSRDKHLPPSINEDDYELTVRNLTQLMNSSDTNFVYKLLNYEDPHYSIKAVSSVKAVRMNNSDLIKLSYEVDDPGICQQTLEMFSEVCIKNYRYIKENKSDEVIKYFENQLREANKQLKYSEDKLLEFNERNNIINYYEQSKAVAVVKEDIDVDYNNKKAQLAGHEAAINRIEKKLDVQQLVQLKSDDLLEKKKKLGELNYEIANFETRKDTGKLAQLNLLKLKKQSEILKLDIKNNVEELYSFQNTTNGLPLNNLLNEWLNNVVEAENLRAKLLVMDQRKREFQKQYAVYAPAGANIKRIEREISVSEQGYLEILHGLNLAKLKLQDSELSANLKTIDPPYFPISPNPTKRKLIIIGAAFVSGILLLGLILMMEYFNDTLTNLDKASKILNMKPLGMLPKIYKNPRFLDFEGIQNRLIQLIAQHLVHTTDKNHFNKKTKTILFFSTQDKEGKTVLIGNITKALIEKGKKVIFVNFSNPNFSHEQGNTYSIVQRLLGYQDPRINFESQILKHPSEFLPQNTYFERKLSNQTYQKLNIENILSDYNIHLDFEPDLIFIELPSIIQNDYSSDLVYSADLSVLICRANRTWANSDQTALNHFQSLNGGNTQYIINGTEIEEAEALIGELPKERSKMRIRFKEYMQFQFFSKNEI
ncbi:MAG: hypothetical protein K1X82_09195 [Bacteroidia bacterium]|nr:hypothetical protein [Bacteroidia bacterium]